MAALCLQPNRTPSPLFPCGSETLIEKRGSPTPRPPTRPRDSRSGVVMEQPPGHALPERRPYASRPTDVRWFKEWVPQHTVSTGGQCYLLKWVTEDMLNAIRDKTKEADDEEKKSEPTTEMLFLCSYEGCGKTFFDVGALKKHAHSHGEKQYVCHYEGCGRKFVDSSKLKRHYLTHTGERDFVCTYEGCGKAFSLDFNLRAHMKTHYLENYHVCQFPECGKRYTHECKLKTHMKTHHEKNAAIDMVKHSSPAEKPQNTPKVIAASYSAASAERPYACPYEGCDKAYIHEYKLNLHLRREHPGHNSEENGKPAQHAMEEASDQYPSTAKGGVGKNPKRNKPNLTSKVPPARVPKRKGLNLTPTVANPVKKQWPSKEMDEDDREEDSEETEEEDRDNVEKDAWRYQEVNEDDEETEE